MVKEYNKDLYVWSINQLEYALTKDISKGLRKDIEEVLTKKKNEDA